MLDQTWSFDVATGNLKSGFTNSCAIGISVAQAHGFVALGACSGALGWTFSAVAIADVDGRCFDAQQLGDTNDEPVVMGDCGAVYTTVGLTLWTLTAANQLRPIGSTKCLDVNASTGELQMEDCTGGASQQWTLMPGGRLLNGASSNCVDAVSDVDGTPVKSGQCVSASGTQTWHMVGFLTTAGPPGPKLGYCLDVVAPPGIADVYGCDQDGEGFQSWSYSW